MNEVFFLNKNQIFISNRSISWHRGHSCQRMITVNRILSTTEQSLVNGIFRCASISWFQVVSQWVTHLSLQLAHLRVFQILFFLKKTCSQKNWQKTHNFQFGFVHFFICFVFLGTGVFKAHPPRCERPAGFCQSTAVICFQPLSETFPPKFGFGLY